MQEPLAHPSFPTTIQVKDVNVLGGTFIAASGTGFVSPTLNATSTFRYLGCLQYRQSPPRAAAQRP